MKNSKTPIWRQKADLTIKTIKAKKEKTSYDWVRLINAQSKIEDKSLSKVYKRLTELSESQKVGVLGKSKFPSFKEFQKSATKGKDYFSLYGGLMILKKFNASENRKAKAKRQNQIQLKKVA